MERTIQLFIIMQIHVVVRAVCKRGRRCLLNILVLASVWQQRPEHKAGTVCCLTVLRTWSPRTDSMRLHLLLKTRTMQLEVNQHPQSGWTFSNRQNGRVCMSGRVLVRTRMDYQLTFEFIHNWFILGSSTRKNFCTLNAYSNFFAATCVCSEKPSGKRGLMMACLCSFFGY